MFSLPSRRWILKSLVKKANRRLYALRQLKKCKGPSADIVHIYCALIRSILEYASAVFADLPKYILLGLMGY